jgi:hypothetical protein
MKKVTINSLKELDNYEWKYQEKEFFFRRFTLVDEYTLSLAIKKFRDYKTGEEEEKNLIHFSLRNLAELEFYGLKVVLNEKPKLSKADKECLEEETYYARDKNGDLYSYSEEPLILILSEAWSSRSSNGRRVELLDRFLFPFITWESGKAWSKTELMELEVGE